MGWEGPITYRQYRTWNQWFDEQWNQTDKLTEYLIQIAAEVRRANPHYKDAGKVKNEDLKLRFHKVDEEGNPIDEEDVYDDEESEEWAATQAMVNVMSRLPPNVPIKVTDPDGTERMALPGDIIRERMKKHSKSPKWTGPSMYDDDEEEAPSEDEQRDSYGEEIAQ